MALSRVAERCIDLLLSAGALLVPSPVLAARVTGRNVLTWEERFRLDVDYVDHWKLALDPPIFARTAGAVLRRPLLGAKDHASMPEFTGRHFITQEGHHGST